MIGKATQEEKHHILKFTFNSLAMDNLVKLSFKFDIMEVNIIIHHYVFSSIAESFEVNTLTLLITSYLM